MKSESLFNAIGEISDDLIDEAKSSICAVRKTKRKRISSKGVLCIAAVLILCLTTVLPVLAVTETEVGYDIVYTISPAIAQRLKPVQRSCVYDGIRMEVISANVSGDTAEVYISMQDLEGDRIDETIDLLDSYYINRSFDCQGGFEFSGYDDKTKTATFLIQIGSMNHEKIRGKKLTFSVERFLSHKRTKIVTLPLLNYDTVQLDPETLSGKELHEKYYINSYSNDSDFKRNRYLKPQTGSSLASIDGIRVTAVAYIDGKLHIQTYTENNLNTDNHCFLYLRDKDGNEMPCTAIGYGSIIDKDGNEIWHQDDFKRYLDFSKGDRLGMYSELVYDIPLEGLEEYTLTGEFVTSDPAYPAVEGDWRITFPIE